MDRLRQIAPSGLSAVRDRLSLKADVMSHKDMSCDNCLRLTSGTPIKLPTDLKRAIKKAAEAVKNGVLKYEGAGYSGDPFEPLARGDHWSDFVSNYFSCKTCGQLFHLHAETYHGAGGAFEKIKKIDEQLQNDTYDT